MSFSGFLQNTNTTILNRNTNNMCNKYILFKENQNYSNFLPGKSNSIFLYLYIWLIFYLSRSPPSGKSRNTLSILRSLRNLRNMRKRELKASLYFNYLCQDTKGCQWDIIFLLCPADRRWIRDKRILKMT